MRAPAVVEERLLPDGAWHDAVEALTACDPLTRQVATALRQAARAAEGEFARSAHDHLPPHIVRWSADTTLLGHPAVLAALLAGRLGLPEGDSATARQAAEDLDRVGQSLEPATRVALDALLRRVLTPFEALATWPLTVLFSPQEVAVIRRHPVRAAPVVGVLPQWRAGHDMTYGRHVCVIVKFSRLCNLRCTYCHDWREGPDASMPFEVLVALMSRLFGGDHPTVELVWHGGEPTHLGRRTFLRVLALERHFARRGLVLRNRVQTNATTITPSWVRLLATYRFGVGVSIDGPPATHDLVRLDVAARPTFARVRRGLRLLGGAGLLDHVYVVVGPAVLTLGAAELLRFLRAEGISRVGLLALRPGAGPTIAAGVHVPHADYVDFLLEVHRERTAHPCPPIAVRELDAAIRAASAQSPAHCELLGACVGTFFSVDPDGTVAHCDKYVGDPAYTLGSVLTHDFDQLAHGPAAQRLREADAVDRTRLDDCRHAARCRGWCPYERYAAARREPEAAPGCCGLSPLFDVLVAEAMAASGPTSAPTSGAGRGR